MVMISDFYNDGYSIIMFTNSAAHVQRKEIGIFFIRDVGLVLNVNNNVMYNVTTIHPGYSLITIKSQIANTHV